MGVPGPYPRRWWPLIASTWRKPRIFRFFRFFAFSAFSHLSGRTCRVCLPSFSLMFRYHCTTILVISLPSLFPTTCFSLFPIISYRIPGFPLYLYLRTFDLLTRSTRSYIYHLYSLLEGNGSDPHLSPFNSKSFLLVLVHPTSLLPQAVSPASSYGLDTIWRSCSKLRVVQGEFRDSALCLPVCPDFVF